MPNFVKKTFVLILSMVSKSQFLESVPKVSNIKLDILDLNAYNS